MSEHWDNEALTDPRYAKASWGMNGDQDAEETIEAILDILETGIRSDVHVKHEVLEIGAGPGRLLLRLADRHPGIVFCGADISAEMMNLYMEIREDRHIQHVGYNCDCLPRGLGLAGLARRCAWNRGEPCEFQFIYAVELFQHLPDDEVQAYIDQALEVLMPGGMLITQWVVRGEPGPHSFPREPDQIRAMFDAWPYLATQEAVHPDWFWIAAKKAR